ncbi:MAG: hypothetical protein ACFFBD_27925 [Candidatus Hodarchaeota archaeon]
MIATKYSFAERIKAELLIASNLTELTKSLEGAERTGGKKLLVHYLNEIVRETSLAQQITQDMAFSESKPFLEAIKKAIEKEEFLAASQSIGHALSKITTICQRTSSLLEKQNLI